MIAKFITSKSSARARHYAFVLMTYFTDPDPRKQIDANGLELALTLATYVKGDKPKPDGEQRVVSAGASIAGEAADWADAAEEMERRLAKRNRRIKKPVRHAVLSFQADENPTQAQCREAVELMTDELGCGDGVVLWSAHGDTDNVHIHMIHIPVDANGERLPYGRAVEGIAPDASGNLPKFAQEGQYKEAMQRALARIEHAQGRTPEPGSRYHIVAGKVERRAPAPTAKASSADIGEAKARWERETGIKGFTRYCQDNGLAIVRAAQSWQNVHEGLAPLGIGIRQTASSSGSAGRGNGGEFYAIDGNKAKLSSVDRSISWGKLIKRLGSYQAAEQMIADDYQPDVIDAEQARRHRDQARAKDAALANLKRRIDALQAARQQAHALLRAQWIAHRADVKQLKIDHSRSELIEALRVIHVKRIKATDDAYRARLSALRSLRRSVDAFTEPHLLDIEALDDEDAALVINWSARRTSAEPVPLMGYTTRRFGDAVRYWQEGDDDTRMPAFVERGDVIWINDRSQAALEAALILAKARHGDVAAFGNARFVKACQQAGRRLGIDVQDGGLKPSTVKAQKVNPRQAARDKALDAALNAQRAAPTQVVEPEMRSDEPIAPLRRPARGRPPRVPNPFGR